MPISPKGITLHEGYNDLGTFEINITDVEQPNDNPVKTLTDAPPVPHTLLFKLELLSGLPIPLEYKGVFTVKGRVESEWVTYEQYPNADGFIQIDTPVLPVVVRTFEDVTETTVIRLNIEGALNERAQEMYLEVNGGGSTMYTLIWDLFVADGELAIFDGDATYYPLTNTIAVGADIKAIHITKLGIVFGYDEVLIEWTNLGTLEFTQIEFPEKLTSYSDGFYQTNGDTGSLTQEDLGVGAFADYTSIVTNPGSYYVDVLLNVFLPGSLVYTHEFTFVTPGSPNYIPVVIDGSAYVPPDTSPTMELIQTLSGITFSAEFLDFLALKEIGTVNDARKAGPIKYINGFPSTDVGAEELEVLQAHTDLYFLNNDAAQNQLLISAGYGSVYKIANTPKNLFIDDVIDATLPLFKAAQIHEVVTQNEHLVHNLLADTITGLQLATPSHPVVPGSNWITTSLANAVNTCGCSDCKSAISPFAYLMDLIKYSAAHVDYGVSYIHGVNTLTQFITLISNQFLQPFGTLNVDCKTLHDEYCRVRLVTEVLEKIVLASTIPSPQDQVLIEERKQYLMLVYKTILTFSGTSINELRDVVSTQPTSEKIKAAQKLANKLGIPLYDPANPTNLTADAMWLSFNLTGANELTAVNLEAIFGFRDTQRNVLTNTPVSLMDDWKITYLREVWKTQDYLFSDFSREDVDPSDDATFKDNWKPIIDPDNMGWEDMTYLTSIYAKALWTRRKEDTDAFLQFCLSNSSSITAVDMTNRILKVTDRDITSHNIQSNIVQIQHPSTLVWTNFTINSRKLLQTDTDVILTKPTPAIFQPNLSALVMRYKRIVNVVATSGPSANITLTWPDDIIFDELPGGYAKFASSASATPYETTATAPYQIVSVTHTNDKQIILNFSSPDFPDSTFLNGTLTFTYEVEVPIYSTTIINPTAICEEFCTNQQSYTLLGTPGTIGTLTNPKLYWVWDLPFGWTAPDVYANLKLIYQSIIAGTATQADKDLIGTNFHMSLEAFNRMMVLFSYCENYLLAMFTYKVPSTEDLYELVSIFRSSAKEQLCSYWVQEEIKHTDGTNPIVLRLSGQYFWKSLSEPQLGQWDPSLQDANIPVIDPELVSKQNMLVNPEAQIYLDLYNIRVTDLANKFNDYMDLILTVPFDVDAFTKILNDINQDDINTDYVIPAYDIPATPANMAVLLSDLVNNDLFKQKKAKDALWTAFKISGDDFLKVWDVKTNYEASNPLLMPGLIELQNTARLLVSAYKRNQMYTIATTGWLDVEATYDGGDPVLYYNVLKMKQAPWRSDATYRSNWQSTLAAWNRQPFIQPDLVPPENIKNFVSTNPVYVTWNTRRSDLINAYNDIEGYINSSVVDSGTLFLNFQDQINLIITRTGSYVPLGPLDYLNYFTDIKVKESEGIDIRPLITQLGFTIIEYRFLAKIYNVLEITPAFDPPPLIDTEYDDVINILIAINSRNLPFDQVVEEYDDDIILDTDYFQIWRPALSNFPLTDLSIYNPWRSPHGLRKIWTDTLQSRIDREKAVKDKWLEVLMEAEDRNMPFLRDALIRALTGPCELWSEVAERLAKTYFIETKDNCCVKHTRVSFAIEMLQGLMFSLQNGIYDDFIANYKLFAPNIKQEWQWIGSYATWRSAMFVFIYPENILYPTLKRVQTSGFIDLASKIQNANRFTPVDACKEAKVFQEYLNDITSLNISCSTNALALSYKNDPNECCESSTEMRLVTYFFGQASSGITYYSSKDYINNTDDALRSWSKIDIPVNAKILGCFSYDRFTNLNTGDTEFSLLLFYTYKKDGKLKLAYVKKIISEINTDWSEEIETGEIQIYNYYELYDITACQSSLYFQRPAFMITYRYLSVAPGGYKNWVTKFSYDVEENQFVEGNTIINPNSHLDTQNMKTAFRFHIFNASNIPVQAGAAVYKNKIYIRLLKDDLVNETVLDGLMNFSNVIGAFASTEEPNTILIFDKQPSNSLGISKIKFTLTFISTGLYSLNWIITPTVTFSTELINLNSICPVFSYDNNFLPVFAVNNYSSYAFVGTQIKTLPAPVNILNTFSLTPQLINAVEVESADCISDMPTRINYIKANILYNKNAQQGGTSQFNVIRPTIVTQLLYEAYYFVPMLLALDQQRRGEFPAALSWYRSVYDYTNTYNANQKIFYGLVIEETIPDLPVQTTNWLLDPLNPHFVAQTRRNAYTKYTLMNIVQCLFAYADREFTLDTIETVPIARKLYTTALNLLKAKELKLKTNLCASISAECLDTNTDMSAARAFANTYSKLKEDLEALGDATIIESLVGDITDLLNSATDETIAEKFADAFELIEDAEPTPPATLTVTEFVVDFSERVNEAYRYLSALNIPTKFSENVGEMYTESIAAISGLKTTEVISTDFETQIAWLQDSLPDNSLPLKFGFATTEGNQLLTGPLAYDPVKPKSRPYTANFEYVNAPSIIGGFQLGMPASYSPLMDFKFCTPLNPIYQTLQLKGNLELYKIFNCRNIAGMVRELNVFATETDSVSGIPIIGASGNLVLPGINNYVPSQYRFSVLIERAKQIASQAQQMESLFLAALEKEDAENYSQLRAKQDLETAKATVKLQDLRITQANDEKVLANLQLNKSVFSRNYFDDLISAGYLSFETASLRYLENAQILQYVSAAASAVAAGIYFSSWASIEQKAAAFSATASAASSIASALSTQSSYLAQIASYQRRAQEWAFQKDLAGQDIGIANQQVKVSEDNVRIVTQEREIAQLSTDHAQVALDFLRTKFTNAELYNWMGSVLERSYSYMLNLSTAIARSAESQLYFERQEQAGPFILNDYWEAPSSGAPGLTSGGGTDRRGLTGSARLLVDITRLDQYAFDTNKRKLQMTKVISLAQNFPAEFQQFKETGVFNFELTNRMFDYDFPGHYLRLVNSVKTTVVGLLPVYDQVKATLTADTISYTVIGGTIFQKIPIRRMELDSVALTAANNATGIFEMQPMQSELLNPFEGMGIESRWEFKMPLFSNYVDYTNIADVLLTVEYTALDSYQYRAQVLQDIDYSTTFNRGFSFKNNFPDQWFELAEVESGPPNFGVTIDLKREMFPQGITDLQLNTAQDIVLYFVREENFEDEISILNFGLVTNPPALSTSYSETNTNNGKLDTGSLMNSIGTSPLVKLQLIFNNTTFTNRELFSTGKIKDIILIVPCKAQLRNYPL